METPLFLQNLDKGRYKNGITVRVIRKWKVFGTTRPCEPLYIGMVLADAKGHAIYAEISSDDIPNKEPLFDTGKVYIVKKFMVTKAKYTYRAVDKGLMIEITSYTTAEVIVNPPQSIPHYIYHITPFSAIKTADVVLKYTDTIGYLVKYKAVHTFVPKGKEKVKKLREIYIKDLKDNMMQITLWGDHATGFNINHVYDEAAGNIVVCLFVGGIPHKDFKDNGRIYLSGSPACAYYFNPTIQEAQPFYSKFKNIPIYIERPSASEEEASDQAQDIQLPQKKFVELIDLDPFDDEDGPYKCVVTITSIVNESGWWYISCKTCKKSPVKQQDGTYKCTKCHDTATVHRYLLTFTAKDETGEAKFFAYDDEAQKIVQKECEAIMNPLRAKAALPQELLNIINKTYVLSVELSNESCASSNKKQYLVKSVLERPSRRTTGHQMLQGSAPILLSTSVPPETQPSDINTQSLQHQDKTGASIATTQSPSSQAHILQIEAAPKLTPAPQIETETSTSKDRPNSPQHSQSTARKRLFDSVGDEIKDGTQEELNHTEDDQEAEVSDSSLQPKKKGRRLPPRSKLLKIHQKLKETRA